MLAADNLEVRDRFIAEVPQLTSAEIGNRAGSSARNLYATAARWKKAGDIFSVHHRGTEYFPAFQLRDGRPHPAIKKALVALPENLSPWQRAFWFVSTNGWLDDKAPMDALDDIDAVAAAAAVNGKRSLGEPPSSAMPAVSFSNDQHPDDQGGYGASSDPSVFVPGRAIQSLQGTADALCAVQRRARQLCRNALCGNEQRGGRLRVDLSRHRTGRRFQDRPASRCRSADGERHRAKA